MPALKKSVMTDINKLIKKFKFDELEDAVLPIFPELSWNSIKSKLAKNHETFTTAHVVPIMENEINKANVDDKSLKLRLSRLEIADISRHYKKKYWYAIEMRGESDVDMTSPEEIEIKIKEVCQAKKMPAEVCAIEYNNVIFLSLRDKPSKNKKKTLPATYFCLVPNESFCFGGQKNIPNIVVDTLVQALGFTKGKHVKLLGRDVFALKELLLLRKEATVNGDFVFKPEIKFKETPPAQTPLGYDFTQHKQRKLQADKCFGDRPPSFESLKVTVSDQPWHYQIARKKLPDEKISTVIEFRSTNVPNFLKYLTEEGILQFPLPVYAANILQLGRNELKVTMNH